MISRDGSQAPISLIPIYEFERDLKSFAGSTALQEKISNKFLDTLISVKQEGKHLGGHNCVDYCFVAMRKKANSQFRYPGQGVYLNEFSLDKNADK